MFVLRYAMLRDVIPLLKKKKKKKASKYCSQVPALRWYSPEIQCDQRYGVTFPYLEEADIRTRSFVDLVCCLLDSGQVRGI